MDKLISASALFDTLRDDINISGANLARIKRYIEAAPEVDAEYCKKCVHYQECNRNRERKENE